MTHADNFNAQEFYEKLGLKAEAKLKNHFYEDKDELVMSVFVEDLEK
jgi:ribosomal protein S18 acetylase RimI-like enzyme